MHIFTASRQPWVVLPPGAPAFAEYHELEGLWPAQSLARREKLMPLIEACQASLQRGADRGTALQIVEAGAHEDHHVMQVDREAFGRDDEARLVASLLQDASARPRLSLLAWDDARPVGHVLFTRA